MVDRGRLNVASSSRLRNSTWRMYRPCDEPRRNACDGCFLSRIAREHPSHAFLRGSSQGLYIRQVEFLSLLLDATFSRPRSTIKVLDWGTGKGHVSYLLRQRGFTVLGADLRRPAGDSAFGQDTPIIAAENAEVVPLD